MRSWLVLAVACCGGLGIFGARALEAHGEDGRHGLSVFGELKYPPGFPHFDYVDPSAPKGGRLRIPGFGTFDSLNGFIRKGRPAIGTRPEDHFIYDSLVAKAEDEPAAGYGLLAERVVLADDRSFIEFTLRPEARWHDGRPVTADDVLFTFETLRGEGSPVLRLMLSRLQRVDKRGPRTIRFVLGDSEDRQLPLTIASLPILPKHYWEKRDIQRTTLEPPLGSGPYRIAHVDPGRSITFERVRDYWAKALPVNVGRYNFDTIRVDYFLDVDVRLEALKGDVIDHGLETVTKTWAQGYDFPARQRGHFKLELVTTDAPGIVRAMIFNTRLPKLSDVRVREALSLAFDREWKNRVHTYGLYVSQDSYFPGSDLAQRGPPSEAELALLEPLRAQLPSQLFERAFAVPATQAVGRNRANLQRALVLLKEAGYEVRDDVLVDRVTGQPFTLELLLDSSGRIRMSLLYADALRKLGIQTRMRVVDVSQLLNRRRSFDFEVLFSYFPMRTVPGTELRSYFGSRAASSPDSRNYAGVSDAAVDALIERVIAARTYDELRVAARALDRALLFGYYMVDLGSAPGARYAFWDRFGRPDETPRFATGFPHTWWFDAERAARIREPAAERGS